MGSCTDRRVLPKGNGTSYISSISLVTHSAAISAFENDVDSELIYAQQVLAYGKPGDVLIGISTSGGAKNVAAAAMTPNSIGLHTIGLSGKDCGRLAQLADLALTMPKSETYRIQDDHLTVTIYCVQSWNMKILMYKC